MTTPETRGRAKVMSLKSALAVSLAVFGVSLASLLLLSRYLGVAPGSVFATTEDFLVSVDGHYRWRVLAGMAPPRFLVSHFLMEPLWGRIGGAVARLFELAWPAEEAHFLAVVGVVCAVAATGFGSLAFCALRLNPRLWNLLLLSTVCLLFTANVIIVQTDHFGLSFGFMTATSLALLPDLEGWTRAGLLGAVGFLSATMTTTNALFPALVATIHYRNRLTPANATRLLYGILAAAVVGSSILVPIIDRLKRNSAETLTVKFIHLRLVRDPLGAAHFAGSGLLYPAVGPTPSVWRRADNPANQSHQSYETSRLGDYAPLSAVAACAWVVLLAASSLVVVRSPDLRNYSYALFGWIAFNFIFHNIWGDEFFLFSAHWSWALMLIVLLGSRGLPTWAVALAAALILPGQLSTLSTIQQLVFA